VRILVIIALLLIVGSLGSALFYLLRKRDDPERMVKALTVRVALSIGLFLLLMAGYYFGWIGPRGL
jgi:uncharacterized membrane protein